MFRNFIGSFYPSKARKELARFLIGNEPFYNWTINTVARDHLIRIRGANSGANEITEDDIRRYRFANEAKLEDLAKQAISDMCARAIPGFDWLVVIKHIGLFGICLVPAISFLLQMLVSKDYDSDATFKIAFALLFLVILFVAVGVALILDASRRK